MLLRDNKLYININNQSILDRINIFAVFMIAILACLAACQGDSPLGTLGFKNYAKYCLYFLSFLSIAIALCKRKIKLLLFLIPVAWWISTHINVYRNFSYDFLIFIELEAILLSSEEIKLRSFIMFRKFLVIVALLGIICYASYKLNLGLPNETIGYYTKDSESLYHNYFISYIYYSDKIGSRLCGLFNEPGRCGTIIALVLCADNVNLRKIENIILFIAGVLTFSLAFVIIISLYIIMSFYKNRALFIALIVFFFVYFFILPNIQLNNVEVQNILSRFTFSNGLIIDDNRTSPEFDAIFNNWLHSSQLFFGYGDGYGHFVGTSSYKVKLLYYGIIGFIAMYGYLLFCAINRIKNSNSIRMLSYVLVFFISIYQRPNIFTGTFMLLLFGGLEYIDLKTFQNRQIEYEVAQL